MPKVKWTLEILMELASQYKTRKDFKEAHKQAYGAVMDKKLANQVFAHMKLIRTYWTEEMLKKTLIGYVDIETYKRENESAYTTICNRGLRLKLLGHIERKHRSHTNKSLHELALKFKTRVEFSRIERAAYNTAINRGILNNICSHMERLVKESWLDSELQILANECSSRQDFKNKYPSAHSISKKRELLDIFFANKKKLVIPFTTEDVMMISRKYKTRVDFQRSDGGAYNKAFRDGFLDDACSHMEAAQKFKPHLPSTFYLLVIESSSIKFIGYGITNNWDVRIKDHQYSLKKSAMFIETIRTYEFSDGYKAKDAEDIFRNKFPLLEIDVRGFKRENTDYGNLKDAIALIEEISAKSDDLSLLKSSLHTISSKFDLTVE
jgi:hypothetical protein